MLWIGLIIGMAAGAALGLTLFALLTAGAEDYEDGAVRKSRTTEEDSIKEDER